MTRQPVIDTPTGRTFQFDVNDRGVIDATGFFHVERFMRGGPDAWTLNRESDPVEALSLHHWAGWFGAKLGQNATPQQEFDQLIACAMYHRNHAAGGGYGIGPAYWLVGFPSGRVWAVGRYGTHRASVAGRSPTSRALWNRRLVALAIAGNYETEAVTPGVARAILTGLSEMYAWPGVPEAAPIYEHGLTPTVNSGGVRYSQSTACPGRHVATWRALGGLDQLPRPFEPDRFNDGYVAALETLAGVLDPAGPLGAAVAAALRSASATDAELRRAAGIVATEKRKRQ